MTLRIPVAAMVAASLLAACSHSKSVRERSDFETNRLRAKSERGVGPRFDQPAEAQAFFLEKRLPAGVSALDPQWYLDASIEADLLGTWSTRAGRLLARNETEEVRSGFSWEPLGPGNIGGRTRVLQFDPVDPDIMYTAGVAGGVWKSTDAGATWVPLSDFTANLAVVSLAIDPTDGDVLYAGTGEGVFSFDSQRGAGIFKSIDAGATWVQLPSTASNTNFHYVNDLIVSPNNSNVVYAATRTGVFRSLDAGTNWTQVHASALQGGCFDLAARSDLATDTVLVSCGTFSAGEIRRNLDAAAAGAWDVVFAPDGMARSMLAIAPSDQAVIYALAACRNTATYSCGDFSDGLRGVFRSIDGGATWTTQVDNTDAEPLNRLLLSNPVFGLLTQCGFGASQFLNQGWYDIALQVDPTNPDRVWAGGIDLFRSDNAGQDWGIASYWWFDSGDPNYAHADNHGLFFHPDYDGVTETRLYATSDGGIHVTENPNAATAVNNGGGLPGVCGATGLPQITWSNLNNGYEVTQFYHGTVYPDQQTYFGGTQDNGTPRGNDIDGPDAWETIRGGDGGYVAVDPTNTLTLWAENTGISIARSIDGGQTFASATSGISDSGLFINPFTLDPNLPSRLWTSGRSLWRTDNRGTSWTQASTQLDPGGARASSHAVAPGNSNLVVVGGSNGFIYRNSAAGSATAATVWNGVQPRSGFVSSVAFDPSNTQTVYATYSTFGGSHVWRSTDGGQTFNAVDNAGQIPDVPVHSLVVHPQDSQNLWIGTDIGVFVTFDGGATWFRENTGFANVFTEHLTIIGGDTRPLQVYAFTHGRSVFRTTVSPAVILIKDGFEDPL